MQSENEVAQTEGILWVQRLSSPDCRVWTEGEIKNSQALSERKKEVVLHIAKENYNERAPLQKELITLFHLNNRGINLPDVKSEHIGGSATINEIVVGRRLDRSPIKAGRLCLPQDFSWLNKYSDEYSEHLCSNPLGNLKRYNPRGQRKLHWTVSVQLAGKDKPCFYSLGLQQPLPSHPSYMCQNSQ